MKNIIIIAAIILAARSAHAQITLEHTFPGVSNFTTVLFSSNGTKYAAKDTGTNNLKLYNTDYTLWKTIPLPIPTGNIIFNIALISDKLFNTDNQVELFASWRTTTAPITYYGAIISETGSIIHDLGSSTIWASVSYIDGVHKLVVGNQNSSSFKVYSVPGELPCGHCGAGSVGVPKIASTAGAAPMAMPNPASGIVTIIHGLPGSVENGIITVTAADGRSVGVFPILQGHNEVVINTEELSQGLYFFMVTAPGVQSTSGSFVK